MRRLRFVTLPLAAAVLLATTPVHAHVSSSGQDYSHFKRPDGSSCCNKLDCRPVGYTHGADGTLIMFPEGRSVVVPPDRVIQRPSDDGNAHWCGMLFTSGDATTFCAILPPQST